jgi:hypothetical protein
MWGQGWVGRTIVSGLDGWEDHALAVGGLALWQQPSARPGQSRLKAPQAMALGGSSTSRAPPLRVPPVFIAGVRYAQVEGNVDTDGQVGGILAAYDASSRELWRLRVYENARRLDLEGDVQDVWFRSMRAEGGHLVIENERGERFEVDPAARRVIGRPAPASAPKSDIDPISGQPRIRRPG